MEAGDILVKAKSPVKDDVVYVHVAVEGWKEGKLARDEFVRSYFPKEIKNKILESHFMDHCRISLCGH